MTEESIQALSILRETGHFNWNLLCFIILLIYVYVSEIQKKNWNLIVSALIYWGLEFCWETINALILYFTQYSAVWTTPGDTSFLIYVGLNIEISIMFAIAAVIVLKALPEDKKTKVMGMPSRIFVPAICGLGGFFVEVILNLFGVLVWEYSWWSLPHIYLLIIGYIAPFFIATFVYDHFTVKTKLAGLGILLMMDAAAFIIFGPVLKWI